MLINDSSIVHLFKFGDVNLAFDCYSGALHSLNEPAYDIVAKIKEYYKNKKNKCNGFSQENFTEDMIEKIKQELKNKWSYETLDEVIFEIESLINKGQLFSGDEIQDKLDYPGKEKNVVKALCLNIAHNCNMSCRYCFAEGGSFGEAFAEEEMMNIETAKNAVDFLLESAGGRTNCEIDFFGGEPLLNWQLVKETVSYAREKAREKDKNIKFTLTTNGLLLNDEVIDFLNDYDFAVVLSLDGRKSVNDFNRKDLNGRGSYDEIVPLFKKLVEKRAHREYFIRGTFTGDNLDFSKDVAHIADLGFRDISLEPVVASKELDYSLENVDFRTIEAQYKNLAFLNENRANSSGGFNFYHFEIDLEGGPCLKKRYSGCGAGLEYLSITPGGKIYPCHQFVGESEFLMGDVNESFSLNTNVRDIFNNNNFLNKQSCNSCWAKFFCGGGCHANAYKLNGTMKKPHELGCKLEKTRLECALYLASKGVLQRYRRV